MKTKTIKLNSDLRKRLLKALAAGELDINDFPEIKEQTVVYPPWMNRETIN